MQTCNVFGRFSSQPAALLHSASLPAGVASLVVPMVKNLPIVQETWVSSWVGKILWGRKWQPTPVFLPGGFHEQRSLASYSPWSRKESDMTEWLILSLSSPGELHQDLYWHAFYPLGVFLKQLKLAFFKAVWFCLMLCFLATPHSMWDLSSPARVQMCTPCIRRAESKPLDHQGSP